MDVDLENVAKNKDQEKESEKGEEKEGKEEKGKEKEKEKERDDEENSVFLICSETNDEITSTQTKNLKKRERGKTKERSSKRKKEKSSHTIQAEERLRALGIDVKHLGGGQLDGHLGKEIGPGFILFLLLHVLSLSEFLSH
jgi:hypothetical protein